MIRALVVDDEPLVRERMRDLLAAHADVGVVGECGDGLSALEARAGLAPDVVFLDIEMPGLTGLEVAEAWRRDGALPHIVFVTAYDQFALEAFRVNALDYLTKPIDPARLAESLARVRIQLQQPSRDELDRRIDALLARHETRRAPRPHLVVKVADRYRLVPTAEILAVEGAGNYACLHCDGASHIVRSTLAALEARLDARDFVRVHRSWIANRRAVWEARPTVKGSWKLFTRTGLEIPVGLQYRDALTELLGG